MKRIQQLDRFFELSPDLLCILDFDGRFVAFNPAWGRTLGYNPEELGSSPYFDLIHADDRAQAIAAAARLDVESTIAMRVRFQCKDGTYKSFHCSCTSDLSRGEIYMIAREVTDAFQTLTSILEASPHAIIAVDAMRKVRVWNMAATRIFGWTEKEVLGGKVPFVTNETRGQSNLFNERALKGETFTNYETRRHRRDGTPIDLLVSAAPTYDSDGAIDGFLTVATDITEYKKLEQQFLRTQRLESLGTLAGGVAHDLNNVLAPIVMGLQLLRMKTSDASTIHTLDTLDECANRGADLIRQVLTFARGVRGERVPVQTRHLLVDVERVIVQTLPRSIHVTVDFPADLWTIAADVTQLHQVLMNLTVNARDAMANGGSLKISAQNVAVDEMYLSIDSNAAPGSYVMIEVEDSGHGIAPEMRDKIFEPFFTTKEPGRGTGLGLSTVAAIVKNHSGFISLHSEVGRGTSFRVYLPALTGEESHAEIPVSHAIPTGNGETILVVDDEAAVRDIAKLTLEANGYRVLTAQDGAQGIEEFAKHLGEVHVVISDMDMPVMNGAAMIRSLERLDPQVRVISTSGLAPAPKSVPAASPFRATLPKPYTAEELLRTVHDVMHAT